MLYLENNSGFQWCHDSSISAKGYLYYKDKFFDANGIISLFEKIGGARDFLEKLKEYDGCYSIAIKKEDCIYAAVDRVRSFPLFYIEKEGELEIFDIISPEIASNKALEIDEVSLSEFKRSGYTIGDKTLLKDVKQLQAGQALIKTKGKLEIRYYYRHYHSQLKSNNSYSEHSKEFKKISNNIFSRMVESCRGRQVAIPLSGGYDSRYIASMLKEVGYESVICYTYGKKGSFEVEVSKKVAGVLGYKWYFVEYTDDKWSILLDDDHYQFFASNFSSLAVRQEYLAVKELKEKGVIDEKTVVIPGFCGDLLGGSYVPEEILQNSFLDLKRNGLVDHIFNINFDLHYEVDNVDCIKINIENEVGDLSAKDQNSFISKNEEFFTRHKVSKFVVNAVRVYEYFGMEWRLPLWDRELYDFWYKIDYTKKIHSHLYNKLLFDNLFFPQKVGYYKKGAGEVKKIIDRNLIIAKIYALFRPFLRYLWHALFENKKYVNFNNTDSLDEMIKNKYRNSEEIKKLDHVNSIAIFWYLKLIQSR